MTTKAKADTNKKGTETRKLVKALIFGPAIATLGVTILYLAWWGLSKAFMAIHAVVTAHFVPWLVENWFVIVGFWAGIAVTSTVYYAIVSSRNKQPKQKPQKKTKKEQKPFDAKANMNEDDGELQMFSNGN